MLIGTARPNFYILEGLHGHHILPCNREARWELGAAPSCNDTAELTYDGLMPGMDVTSLIVSINRRPICFLIAHGRSYGLTTRTHNTYPLKASAFKQQNRISPLSAGPTQCPDPGGGFARIDLHRYGISVQASKYGFP